MLFGSELFEEYIGQLAMASMASLDIFTEGEQIDAKKLQEKMRVIFLTSFLIVRQFITILLTSLLSLFWSSIFKMFDINSLL